MYPVVTQKLQSIQPKLSSETETHTNLGALDSDGDRLYDWEEALIGTNPNNPDTNNNSVSDYDENKLDTQSEIDSIDVSLQNKDSNYTDALARDLYTSLLLTEQQQGSITDAQKTQLADIAIQGISEIKPREYSLLDIRTIPDSRDARIRFIAAVYTIQKTYPMAFSDVPALMTMIESDEPIPAELKTRTKSKIAMVPALLATPVPQKFASEYLAYINAISGYVSAVAILANADSDPAPAFQMIKQIPFIVDSLESATTAFTKSIQKQ